MGNEIGSQNFLLQPQPDNKGFIQTQYTSQTYHPLEYGTLQPILGGSLRKSPFLVSTPTTYTFLRSPPNNTQLNFTCSFCNRKIYDGGLCKFSQCDCGIYFQRDQKEEIKTSFQVQKSFQRLFQQLMLIPQASFIPTLISINLGIFKQDLPKQFLYEGKINSKAIHHFYLNPYFQKRLRCLGVGEFFQYGDAKFKVIAAYPNYGIITQTTAIQCSEIFSKQSITNVQITPVKPGFFCPQKFKKEMIPYFKSVPRHLHKEQYLFIGAQEYVVESAQPNDGIVNEDTQFFVEGEALDNLFHLGLAPCIQDLTFNCQSLSRSQLISLVFNEFLMPFFQGHRRVVSKHRLFWCKNTQFKVIDCWPPKGIVNEKTVIIFQGTIWRAYQNIDMNLFNYLNRGPYFLMDSISLLSQPLNPSGYIQNTSVNSYQIIQQLPTHKISQKTQNPQSIKCLICMCHFELDDEIKTLPCFHIYHITCIDQWLTQNLVCPVCKYSVNINNQQLQGFQGLV